MNDIILVLLLLGGMASHFLKKLIEARQSGNDFDLIQYFKANPYQTALSIISGFVGFFALYGTAELTRVTAFGLGYMCNSVADIVGERSVKKLQAKL